jgi:hypothetical protein
MLTRNREDTSGNPGAHNKRPAEYYEEDPFRLIDFLSVVELKYWLSFTRLLSVLAKILARRFEASLIF